MRIFLIALTFFLAFGNLAEAAQAGGRNGRPNAPPRGNDSSIENFVAGFSFDAGVERIVRNYFGAHPVTPQGLPPGIAKNYARGKPLPPGIAKRYLPGDLRRQLPEYPGYDVLIVDRDVLLVSVATGIVADILRDVL